MNSLTLLAITLCLFALAYRYYAAFLAAKVAVLDPDRPTPAHQFRDGRDYHPTNRYILFGHHFAAIAGPGPLIGPVLAAQYGYLPGALWILIGAVFAGGVHDYMALYASTRSGGQSISRIAHTIQGSVAGWCTGFAALFIIIVALAGLGVVVVNALRESPWGVFAIICSIPIAVLMGQMLYRIRPGKVAEASAVGVVLLVAAVTLGGKVPGSSLAGYFTFSEHSLKSLLPLYGFAAAALPVWMVLCPRDYLSTYLKLGVVALLAIGFLIVHPDLTFPAVDSRFLSGGPVVPGPIWPYVCLTIACGAISGFHSLVGSGTTPKMINSESDIKFIGYGAMLVEGVVGILALIAACSLFQNDWLAINANPVKFPQFAADVTELPELTRLVGEETLVGRTGGAVTLAVGMAKIFGSIPGMKHLMAYWYHFAIMFEALFILTVIDTGTRVARFILQELGAGVRPVLGPLWKPGWQLLRAGAAVAAAWSLWMLARAGSVGALDIVVLAGALGATWAIGRLTPKYGPGAATTGIGFASVLLRLTICSIAGIWVISHLTAAAGSEYPAIVYLGILAATLAVASGNAVWAASAAVTFGWAYLLWGASITTIWPMFGVANQLLGVIALALGTTFILRRSKKRVYALVTFLPVTFMVATVFTAGLQNLFNIYLNPKSPMPVSAGLTVVMLGLAAVVVIDSLIKWYAILTGGPSGHKPGETSGGIDIDTEVMQGRVC
ncbi:MAG: carbon starvation protein A [Armatimonadetes bacterium]|nr:carbon starvation protein A [Armatimonadota bacterium]